MHVGHFPVLRGIPRNVWITSPKMMIVPGHVTSFSLWKFLPQLIRRMPGHFHMFPFAAAQFQAR
jgi:hypothetical protein